MEWNGSVARPFKLHSPSALSALRAMGYVLSARCNSNSIQPFFPHSAVFQSINFISSSLQVQWNQGLWNGMKSASWNGIKPRRGAELITSPFSNKEGSKTTILLIQSNNSPIHSIKFHLIELVSCLWLARLLSLMKIADCCPMAGGREEERLKSSSIHQLFHSFILQQIDSFRMGHSAGQRKQVFFSLPLVSFLGWSAPFN